MTRTELLTSLKMIDFFEVVEVFDISAIARIITGIRCKTPTRARPNFVNQPTMQVCFVADVTGEREGMIVSLNVGRRRSLRDNSLLNFLRRLIE